MKVVSIGAVLLGVAFACYEFFHWMTHVYEFDARIKSDLTRVSSKVDGTIEKILFKDISLRSSNEILDPLFKPGALVTVSPLRKPETLIFVAS